MTKKTTTTTAKPVAVPVLDRQLFFGNPEISGGQLSPDGKWISFLKELDGIMNIWVKKFDEPFEKAKPITNSTRPMYGYFWTFDSKYILYIKDKDGDENTNIFAVNPAASPAPNEKVPASKNLTPQKDVAAQIYNVSRNNPDVLMIGLNDRDKAWHDLYELHISTGETKKLFENTDRITGWSFDWNEKARLAFKTDEKGNSEILRVDAGNKFTSIYSTNVKENAGPSGWTKDNSEFYLVSNKGDVDLSTLYLMNPDTKKIKLVEKDPLNKVDFGNIFLDDNTHQIINTSYTEDKTRYYWKDKTWEANYKYLKSKFPGREIDFSSSTKDYKKLLIAVWGDKYATEVYYFDVATKKLILQYTPRPELKKYEKYLSPMTPITYKSSDGLSIPAYLTLPYGKSGKNLPLVVVVHGGPKGPRDTWGYDGETQFLANRGYAVLQPNFRASGGYGKHFLNAGDKEWGAKMQDDITWGVKHLISTGIADKNRVGIMGGSYGGYATLAGLTFTPDLYKCGVDIVGPSNLFTLLESIPAYWESGRVWLYEMVGDPNTEEGKALLTKSSPLFHADNIVKPLMIVQGANDPRVKKAESDQIVIKMREKKKDVQYLLAKDEGHGFAKPLNRMAQYAATEKFLAEYLGGTYQKDMPQDVADKLKELTVDISTVKLQPKETVKLAASLPAVDNQLNAGTTEYDILIEVQGQKIPMTMTRTIEVAGDQYTIKDYSKGMMGEMTDKIVYKKSFEPVNRIFTQNGQDISLNYGADKTTITSEGQNMEVKNEGAVVSDGPGMDYLIAGLPLAKGYTLGFSTVDMMSMKSKKMALKVLDNEDVNGVSCVKVEVTSQDDPNDKTTYWIDTKQKLALKSTQTIPALMNAVMTVTKK